MSERLTSCFRHCVDARLLQPVACDSLIRLGSANDGGYVVPSDAIAHASTLLSFGLSSDWNFERAAAQLNPALLIHAYDHTVGRKRFAEFAVRNAINILLRLIGLSPRGAASSFRQLKNSLDYFTFFTGRVQHHEHRIWYNGDGGSAAVVDVIDRAGPHAPLSIFAKIDIEGTEYRILPDVAARADLFTGLVVEFHDTDICADAFNAQLRLLGRSFNVVHVHGNNHGDLSIDRSLPLALEVSFLNKQLFARPPVPYVGPLPRPGLDRPNDPRKPDYVMTFDGT
jgi:hypothetical protein